MKLSEISITEEDLLEGFQNGAEIVEEHRQVVAMLKQGFSPPEIGQMLGKSAHARAHNIIRSGGTLKPRALHAVDYLTDLELLPLTAQSKKLPLLNFLSCLTFWRGTRSLALKNSNTNMVYAQNDEQIKMAKDAIRGLGAKPMKRERSGHFKVRPIAYDARIGRIMELMGHSAGSKSDSTIIAPGQVLAAWNTVKHVDSDEHERHLAVDIIRDYVLLFLNVRGNLLKRSSLTSASLDTPEAARRHGVHLAKMGNFSLPSLRFKCGEPQIRETSSFCAIHISGSKQDKALVPKATRMRLKKLIDRTLA